MCLKFSHKERNQGVYCRAESAKITGFNFELISGEAGSKSGWGKYPARTGLHAPSQDALRSGGSQSMSTTVGSPEQVEVAPFGIAGAREFHHRLGGRPIERIHLLWVVRATTWLRDHTFPPRTPAPVSSTSGSAAVRSCEFIFLGRCGQRPVSATTFSPTASGRAQYSAICAWLRESMCRAPAWLRCFGIRCRAPRPGQTCARHFASFHRRSACL